MVWVLLTTAYFLLPFSGVHGGRGVTHLIESLVVFALAAAWELRQTAKAELPEFRAATVFGALTPLFILLFAGMYLSLSHATPDAFSTPLDHAKSLYFVITTLATVGYGDITPTSNSSRMIVSVQMLLDLVLIGSIIRITTRAAQRGLERGRTGTVPPERTTDEA